jgi:hypothetical protein
VRASLGQPEAAQAMAAVAASASPTSSQPRLPLTRANLRGHGAPLRPDIRRPRLGGSPGKPTTACTRAPIPRSLRSEVAFALGDRSSIIDGGSCPGASRMVAAGEGFGVAENSPSRGPRLSSYAVLRPGSIRRSGSPGPTHPPLTSRCRLLVAVIPGASLRG